MRVISAHDIEAVMRFRDLIETLRRAFRTGAQYPKPLECAIERPEGEPPSRLLVEPAWNDFKAQGTSEKGFIGTKITSHTLGASPSADTRQTGVYLLQSGKTGEPLAVIDGHYLNLWRTAATSALASFYLSREDSSKLLVIGANRLAAYLINAHADVRSIKQVLVWDEDPLAAQRLVKHMRSTALDIRVTDDLAGAVSGADIICHANEAAEPTIKGEWLQEGCHLDMPVTTADRAFRCDGITMDMARIFVGSPLEAAETAESRQEGERSTLTPEIAAYLAELCQGSKAGRRFYNQITLFKSAGSPLEDLATAGHIFLRT
ncbi:ornithine cyclodeaminase [Rhodobacteraceae bacterium RKSG542]|uniref:ornithine cyclodeaminase n=1 Tax=Pseudovibrio flavus TaxID=2529854 RepID=UPI0012BC4A0D|nr:ornithine cyclodeaminase [Pseudovibrio flavus]MTI17797.1 ornithine cyclodeaminase [Pseudovibrio flavus]